MKKNDIVTLQIEDLNNLGYGVAHINGKTVFISGAVDGDTVKCKIIKDCGTYFIGKAEELITPSEFRIAPECKVCSQCGGCAYAQISYTHERDIKKGTVISAFRKAGLPDTDIADVTNDGNTSFYRNKAIIPIGYSDKLGFFSGFYAPKTHRIIPADTCLLHKKIFTDITDLIKAVMYEDKKLYLTSEGLPVIKSLYFRAAENNDTELTLILEEEKRIATESLCEDVVAKFPNVKTVLTNLNPGDISTVLSHDFKLIYGDGHIYDTLCGARLKITPASFYQVNRNMAELLYKKGAELINVGENETVCDLYCGIGSIGLSVFRGHKLTGIEVVESAVECAKENAAENNVVADYYCGDAGDVIEKMNLTFDAVVLDPPRKGCTPELINYLCDKKKIKKILYISCNPATLARDAKQMLSLGYEMTKVYPYDLFPRTGHVECVTCFTLK
ncbi:MAG: 23S rRNA (uracil(1939)-C(5))-methyltransferase RlmD [Clostridia bacterium]|nr:23S rRNA (uracil(1939)-C(5))-methyltransferase RlmD [Clostridia bacterium]